MDRALQWGPSLTGQEEIYIFFWACEKNGFSFGMWSAYLKIGGKNVGCGCKECKINYFLEVYFPLRCQERKKVLLKSWALIAAQQISECGHINQEFA